MALIITQQDNTIFLEGTLNTNTLKHFKMHLDYVQNPFNSLTLNIENLTPIDAYVTMALREMYKNAILNHNIFFVEGKRSEEIYESFQFPQVA